MSNLSREPFVAGTGREARGRLAILSMHTSPLAQAGAGDGGGMNVYVRELASSLARTGVECEVFTRAESPDQAAAVSVEPGFTLHNVAAGPLAPVAKESLVDHVDEWTQAVGAELRAMEANDMPASAIHTNYWLSGLAGHTLKHELEVPLLVTFHTLDRVKSDSALGGSTFGEPAMRSAAEAQLVGCADALLASCRVEADQLVDLYGAERSRIVSVPPGVQHAYFGPGNRAQARRAVGLDPDAPVILFVGRIQPLKGPSMAAEVLVELHRSRRDSLDRNSPARNSPAPTLVIVGGPSGPDGNREMARVQSIISAEGLSDFVRILDPQPHEMLSTYYRAADVCLVPSYSESFGMVALEAAACATPVVAAAVGGLTTVVVDGETGFLVSDRSAKGFAGPVARLLGSPEYAARIGRRATSCAKAYTWSRAAGRMWERVESLTGSELVACG